MSTEGETIIWKSKNYELSFIKPCATNVNKKSVKGKIVFKRGRDLKKIYMKLLNKLDDARNVKYSSELGIIKLNLDDKEIIISGTGNIDILNAKNEADVLRTFRKINEMINV